MDSFSRAVGAALGLLAAATLAYPFVPLGTGGLSVYYDTVAVLAVVVGFAGVTRHRPVRRAGWVLVLAGFGGLVVGDLVFSFEQDVLQLDGYPLLSDAVYLGGYVLLTWGAVVMVRTRRTASDLNVVLDGFIVAVGAGVLVAVFLIAPLAEDSTLSLAGKLTSSAYPVADLLLLAVLVRLGATPGARTTAFRLLMAALGLTLLADGVWNVSTVVTGDSTSTLWNDVLWLSGYLAVGAAACVPSMRALAEQSPDPEEGGIGRPRLVMLAVGLALPAIALLLDGLVDGKVLWQVVGIGSLLLSVLVLARMVGLLRTVSVQAVRLAALARSDALTGAPNRRTWDMELSRACKVSRDAATPLSVAMLDIDHFKVYNDTHGHQAGDLVLREVVAAWTEQLGEEGFLARYGGEEFAVLFPELTPGVAAARLEALRRVTPHGQTFSAGVALWDPLTEPGAAVAQADAALYDAKRTGRDRILIAEQGARDVPDPTIALQPIVDMQTRQEVAVEALSRFEHGTPTEVFEVARREGTGPALEAAAIAAALRHRTEDRLLSVNASLPALFTRDVADVLPADLSGIIIEITEYSDVEDSPELHRMVDDLRRRGAQIAVDDWGTGFSNLDRVLRLRPEVVKVDVSLVQHLDSPYFRAAVRAIMTWADEVGATICAEGIETEEHWRAAQALGIHTGQGYYFGHPAVPGDGSGQEVPAGLAAEPA